mmetsp:Transcript_33761/g.65824  ORF Transcript_33761/g.65824 Transcript_33761/m.65824 type:complete len:449 (+) Transcript_33761:56-1402(+)|eukprot:CAMPEP_0173383564 /NCGR_PEP_ID=MMETSP1356-20130122/6135_1 /TAXON_ID=77927 ORGANISM="Hemiselmis virescens, Strain PCC157" /NCGR_SAMPLE_ID=MMETSP1356 /ASSEMBLY_ACC=CAM_ASM_000847 /LENGTH=448 /DNA_ID=CAMNT_0014338509 /DNA_START=43 /DNA_END=1389 /DNA_ORIENTATION=-
MVEGKVEKPVVEAGGARAKNHDEKVQKWASIISFQDRPSHLSSEHPSNNLRGFVNCAMILLVVGNLRIAMQNLQKYGVLVDLSIALTPAGWPMPFLIGIQNANVILAYFIEMAACGFLRHHLLVTRVLHVANGLSAFGVCWAGIVVLRCNPATAVIVLCFATVAMMKILSFAHVCDMRRRLSEGKDNEPYPSISHLYYFIAAPTLVYAPVYPRAKVRWYWLGRRVVEFVGIWLAIYVIAIQYVAPGIKNTLDPLARGNLPLIVEGLLKIAVPNFIVWILGFYSIFHLYLNIIGEIIGYADREFYRDWWNSTTLGYFWRSWNLPVHTWMVAHVYFPLVSRGWKKPAASFVIFIISAVLHELVVSIPFGNFKLLAFGGMMLQVPLIQITDRFKGTQTGNVIFWLTIMLGQPMIVLLYTRDYMKGLSGPWNDEDTRIWGKIMSSLISIFTF